LCQKGRVLDGRLEALVGVLQEGRVGRGRRRGGGREGEQAAVLSLGGSTEDGEAVGSNRNVRGDVGVGCGVSGDPSFALGGLDLEAE
jgi:hypothetical protein